MTMAVFLLIQGCMLAAWWRALATLRRPLTTSQRLLVAGVGYFTQIIASGIALGLVHRLTPQRHLQANLLIALALIVIAMRRGEARRSPRLTRLPVGRGVLRAINITLLVALAFVLSMTLWYGAVRMDHGYDALTYHLPMVVSMMQQHQLRPWGTYMPIVFSYPKSVQLYMLWVLAFFGHDRWIDLAQLPFLPLAMLAVYCIARRLHTTRPAALAGALLFPFSPVVLMQLTTCYIDVATSAMLLAAIALLLIYAQRPNWWMWLLFSAALGMLLGTKFSAVYQVAVLLGAGLCMGRTISPAWRGLAAAPVIAAIGGETYLRNALEHSNPFHPYKVDIAGIVQFPGPWDPTKVAGLVEMAQVSPLQRIAASWAYVEHVSHTGAFGGLGLMWPVALLLIVAAIVIAVRTGPRRLLPMVALFVLLFVLTPLNFRARFVIYVLGLAGVCAAVVLSHAGRLRRHRRPALTLAAAACLTIPIVTIAQVAPRHILPLLAAARDPVVAADLAYQDRYTLVSPTHRPAYKWVHEHIGDGERVVFLRGPYPCFHYLLWNERFSNTVRVDYDQGPDGFANTLANHRGAYFVIPQQARLYEQYAAQAHRFETLLDTPAVVIVRERK